LGTKRSHSVSGNAVELSAYKGNMEHIEFLNIRTSESLRININKKKNNNEELITSEEDLLTDEDQPDGNLAQKL